MEELGVFGWRYLEGIWMYGFEVREKFWVAFSGCGR